MRRVGGLRRRVTRRAIASPRGVRTGSSLEARLLLQLRALRLPEPDREVELIPGRKFRWDFAWPAHKLAVEVQGGEWMAKGGHNSAAGLQRDCEKAALATLAGWRQLSVTGSMVRSGRAVALIESALRMQPEPYGPRTPGEPPRTTTRRENEL